MQTVTLTLDVPDELASRFYALPAATVNHFALALLPGVLDAAEEATEPAEEPIDEAFIAQLIAADEEAKRVGTIPFEEVLRQAQADDGPGFVERLRARLVNEGVNPAQVIGVSAGATV